MRLQGLSGLHYYLIMLLRIDCSDIMQGIGGFGSFQGNFL